MPPDGDGNLNVVVRDGKVKGETKCRADRTVSTGGYAATKKKIENSEAGFTKDRASMNIVLAQDISAIRFRIR